MTVLGPHDPRAMTEDDARACLDATNEMRALLGMRPAKGTPGDLLRRHVRKGTPTGRLVQIALDEHERLMKEGEL